MRKLFKNKKGVSTVISTVLMIMVVMIGMSLLFAYLATYAQNFQAGSGRSVMESMTVEDVWFKTSDPNSVYLSIYNVGKADFTINSIYVNNTPVPFNVTSVGVNSNIPVNTHAKIVVTLMWGNGVDFNFKIVTNRGSTFEEKYNSLS
jgi:FlaG/FlaF family flagellin (archaellin)